MFFFRRRPRRKQPELKARDIESLRFSPFHFIPRGQIKKSGQSLIVNQFLLKRNLFYPIMPAFQPIWQII
ncbi:hypothetical protein JCM21531_4251 [Acetivibrio straminisolvens JCM 21531]|uniref:Uncharacterized protein n=1 Tax=Acetivibrio straminisolvens JCM 21531 TaxID=1294263 RepID=W4VB16_9FIRM|nr:hypothetical protein JCM21531_4251 [Acetivibrio straminisolvens JCM 21531]